MLALSRGHEDVTELELYVSEHDSPRDGLFRRRSFEAQARPSSHELPPEIGALSKLKDLRLGHNGLTALPASIKNLRRLEKLDLRACAMTELPSELWQLTALRELDIAHNDLRMLSPDIAGLTSLEKLDISGNSLATLPDTFGRLEKLETLRLHGAPADNLADHLRQLPSLEGSRSIPHCTISARSRRRCRNTLRFSEELRKALEVNIRTTRAHQVVDSVAAESVPAEGQRGATLAQ